MYNPNTENKQFIETVPEEAQMLNKVHKSLNKLL